MAAGAYAAAGLAAFDIYAGYLQANNIARQARLNNQINQMNAKYAELDAYEAEKFGYTQSARYQAVVDNVASQQRSGYASQGVDISSGTAKEMQNESRLTGILNVIDIQAEARKKSMGLKNEAGNIRLGAGMRTAQAAAESSAAITSGISSAARTGISAYDRYGGSGKTTPDGNTPTTSGSNWASTEVKYDASPISYNSGTFGSFR